MVFPSQTTIDTHLRTASERVLVVAPNVPFPASNGERVRHYQLIECLTQEFACDVVAFASHDKANELMVERELRERLGINELQLVERPNRRRQLWALLSLVTSVPLGVYLFRSNRMRQVLKQKSRKQRYDACIILGNICMAPYIDEIEANRLVWDLCDDLPAFFRHRAMVSRNILKKHYYDRQAHILDAYVKRIAKRVDFVSVSAEPDTAGLDAEPGSQVVVIPHFVDLEVFKPKNSDVLARKKNIRVLFTGSMGYGPNRDALKFLLDDIWPDLKRSVPLLELHVVGNGASEASRDGTDVSFTDYVDDLASWYRSCDIYVCPLRAGAGVKIKVLEAMASGCPIVTSSIGVQGLTVQNGREILIANGAQEFIQSIQHLCSDEQLRKEMGSRAREFMEGVQCRWEAKRAQLIEIIREKYPVSQGVSLKENR